MTISSREIRLVARPDGVPALENFAIESVSLPAPMDGQVLVRNLYMSVDPYMRARMNAGKSYLPPYEVGQALDGRAIGEVVESRSVSLSPGAIVTSNYGWRESFVAPAAHLQSVERGDHPLTAYLGVLGMPGLTAWVGLNLTATRQGDRVFVSGAAGAVGHIAGQLAKLRGCFVVGSAGSEAKASMLVDELGFDAAINYRKGELLTQLARAAPEGIDVYFDNVGGDHLEAALTVMRQHGRISACGAISTYNDRTAAPGPRNLFLVVTKRLTIRGFMVGDSFNQLAEFRADVGPLLASGTLRAKETTVEGLDQAPRAFIDMLGGANVGKMIVKVG
jgi:NADPH-dependent curcumin reductase CurA